MDTETNIRNNRIELENKYVSENYKKILNTKLDIDNLSSAIRIEQNKINKINNQLDYPNGSSIKTIKSANNGTILSLNPVQDTDTYQININGQCLSIYNKNIMIKPCQKGIIITDSQKFHTNRIMTPLHAKTVMNSDIYNHNIVYPYNIFRDSMDGKCMTLNEDGDLILQKCNPNNILQQWKISPNENICPKIIT